MKTTILEKIFTVFCLLNKMTMLLLFLKNFIAATVLRTILVNFGGIFNRWRWKMIFMLILTQNIFFIVLMTYGNSRQKIKHTIKMLNSIGMQEIEEKSKQFLIEKIIHDSEFKNLYKIQTEKKVRNHQNCWK